MGGVGVEAGVEAGGTERLDVGAAVFLIGTAGCERSGNVCAGCAGVEAGVGVDVGGESKCVSPSTKANLSCCARRARSSPCYRSDQHSLVCLSLVLCSRWHRRLAGGNMTHCSPSGLCFPKLKVPLP